MASLFTQYFLQFLSNGFHILRYGDQTLNRLSFRDCGSIFKVIEGHYVSKLTLFT